MTEEDIDRKVAVLATLGWDSRLLDCAATLAAAMVANEFLSAEQIAGRALRVAKILVVNCAQSSGAAGADS